MKIPCSILIVLSLHITGTSATHWFFQDTPSLPEASSEPKERQLMMAMMMGSGMMKSSSSKGKKTVSPITPSPVTPSPTPPTATAGPSFSAAPSVAPTTPLPTVSPTVGKKGKGKGGMMMKVTGPMSTKSTKGTTSSSVTTPLTIFAMAGSKSVKSPNTVITNPIVVSSPIQSPPTSMGMGMSSPSSSMGMDSSSSGMGSMANDDDDSHTPN
eukprot:CAMPEP_0172445902 /NCGR_PEP_ID=MMETSP1065-20121228/5666_1 /TAXON_ID=265537 /ORGANISM="Amphiprora paludosa, Strain CCMP125" /LENGTH=211 /DNA_ID=CAMNT_0013196915 /DNA_START=105 /DNA_END=741 /DNA_ORIENTATION=+